MPNDADSLIEPDVDDPAENSSDEDAPGDVADPSAADAVEPDALDTTDDAEAETADAADPEPADDDTQAVRVVDRDAEPDEDAEEDSPFGDGLRLPDEDGYDGVDYSDGDLDDEYEYEYAYADEMLFEGDPDDYELDFGPGGYATPARPQPGDVLVLDDAGMHQPPPRPRRMSRMERRRRVRLQARRVRRIIRHVEPWSVLKVSIFFYACLWVIFLVAGFMIWGVAESSGTVDKLESLITDLFALDTFDFDAGQIFRGYALGGLALSIAGTTFNVLMCLLFNLISDLTGGVRITMIEEESARPIPPRRRRRRRPPARR
ncbi:MAG: DUF3566 domain-containing protein [Actinomycetota bacterium]